MIYNLVNIYNNWNAWFRILYLRCTIFHRTFFIPPARVVRRTGHHSPILFHCVAPQRAWLGIIVLREWHKLYQCSSGIKKITLLITSWYKPCFNIFNIWLELSESSNADIELKPNQILDLFGDYSLLLSWMLYVISWI